MDDVFAETVYIQIKHVIRGTTRTVDFSYQIGADSQLDEFPEALGFIMANALKASLAANNCGDDLAFWREFGRESGPLLRRHGVEIIVPTEFDPMQTEDATGKGL